MKHDQNTKHNSTTERSVMRSKGPYFLIQCEGDENTLLQLLHCSQCISRNSKQPIHSFNVFSLISKLYRRSVSITFQPRTKQVHQIFFTQQKIKRQKKKILKKKINTETTLLDCFYALAINKEHHTIPLVSCKNSRFN